MPFDVTVMSHGVTNQVHHEFIWWLSACQYQAITLINVGFLASHSQELFLMKF